MGCYCTTTLGAFWRAEINPDEPPVLWVVGHIVIEAATFHGYSFLRRERAPGGECFLFPHWLSLSSSSLRVRHVRTW